MSLTATQKRLGTGILYVRAIFGAFNSVESVYHVTRDLFLLDNVRRAAFSYPVQAVFSYSKQLAQVFQRFAVNSGDLPKTKQVLDDLWESRLKGGENRFIQDFRVVRLRPQLKGAL